ncbi:hypothetical protein [Gemmatimonas sp.]|uniref:hypothetical protein n=1 Tax=Gemmatimonas sp. TaxID=1962908 RepID=UPI003567DDD3
MDAIFLGLPAVTLREELAAKDPIENDALPGGRRLHHRRRIERRCSTHLRA